MKREDIRWVAIDREDLLDVLLGEHEPPNIGRRSLSELELRGTRLTVGYSDTSQRGHTPPSLIIIADDTVPETLSWLRTFAGESSPLSQYARVILASEWRQFEALLDVSVDTGQRVDRWASIAVGEAISQVDSETELQNLPLSRLAGCFTTPVARAALVWGEGQATRTCADRLRLLETDRRFGRRSVSVEHLMPVWLIAGTDIDSYLAPTEAATLILEAASQHLMNAHNGVATLLAPTVLGDYPELSSDSVEESVSAFNRFAQQFQQKTTLTTQDPTVASVAIAAAAFLVGRGTSHLFLLQRAQWFAPTAAAWFGAMAALAGPRTWDKAWLRAVKGSERLLRPGFSWLEPSGADICWAEFAWLAKTFNGPNAFLELPKMLPRTLSIEVVPGATCQLRILGDVPETIEPRPTPVPTSVPQRVSYREQALEDVLDQFVALAKQAGNLLPGMLPRVSEPAQKSFKLESDLVANKKPSKARKPKRETRS
jgi:hypothetical protein